MVAGSGGYSLRAAVEQQHGLESSTINSRPGGEGEIHNNRLTVQLVFPSKSLKAC